MALHAINAPFGATLKQFREAVGVSQTKLAILAEFDHSYVSRLESGGRTPTRDAVEKLSQSLNLTRLQEDELLASAGFLPKDAVWILRAEPEVAEVVGMLQGSDLSETHKMILRQMLGLLAEQAKMAIPNDPNMYQLPIAL